MGYQRARELRAYLSEDVALSQEQLFNHYPPVLLKFMSVAREALRFAREGDCHHCANSVSPGGSRLCEPATPRSGCDNN